MRRVSTIGLVFALCLAAVLALTLAGCSSGGTSGTSSGGTSGGGSGGTSTGGTTITEQNFAFNPSTASVKVGDTVSFVNKDSTQHHVFVGSTDLGVQDPGATVTWKATAAGNFPIKCVIHPTMTGDLTVQ